VTSSATNVDMSATPPSAADVDGFLRSALARNGVISARTTVKMTRATMNAVTSMSKPSSTSEAAISPTAFPASEIAVLTRNRTTAVSVPRTADADGA
jgi:hypothetical protein